MYSFRAYFIPWVGEKRLKIWLYYIKQQGFSLGFWQSLYRFCRLVWRHMLFRNSPPPPPWNVSITPIGLRCPTLQSHLLAYSPTEVPRASPRRAYRLSNLTYQTMSGSVFSVLRSKTTTTTLSTAS